MADPIDPRLYASPVPPRDQSYTSAPQHAASQPYYLPSPAQHQFSQLAQAPSLISALDPALEPTSHAGSDEGRDDDGHDNDGEHDGTQDTPGSAKSPCDFKRLRACDSCRGLKVRCDQERPGQSCRRCAKAGRPCITTPPTRKRQKKADSRVAELERKIDALTATLHAQKAAVPDLKHHGGIPQYDGNTTAAATPEASFRMGTVSHEWSSPSFTRHSDIPPGYGPAQNIQRGPDSKRRKLADGHTTDNTRSKIELPLPEMRRTNITRVHPDYSHILASIDKLMSLETAERIFARYINEICPNFPAVPFPPGTTASEIRGLRPLLFLGIMATASHGSAELLVSQNVQRELIKLLKDELADAIWRNGEKSLELVQTLQVSVLWYRPPLHFEQHSFYMMANVAAVMALDLGLGRKATPNIMKLSVGPFRRFHPNSSSIEARRAFLVCYWLCMCVTMVLRRPILLRWTKYMDESVQILETSPDAYPSDKILCQQFKMARIGESISVQFCMDDPSAEVSICEPKVIHALKIFENELQQLREQNAKLGDSVPLKLAEHLTNLYLHEISLHQNQGAADFHPPFESPDAMVSGVKKDTPIGPAHIGALGECLTAMHGMLDTILGIHLDVLITFPVIFCVRSIYAIVCLMKMWVSVTTSGEVSKIIKQEDLQIESYTEHLVTMFHSIVSRDAQTPHGKFYFVAKRLQERFAHIKAGTKNEKHEINPDFARTQNVQKSAKDKANLPSQQSPARQTPLHLLSEVAMGSSNNSPSQQHVQPHLRSQQQAQAALQAQAQHSQHSMPPNWYPGMPAQTSEMLGFQPSNFDMNFDFTQFDLGTGSDADLSALFIPDSMAMWNYQPVEQPMDGGYNEM